MKNNKLVGYRKMANLTQDDLAKALGIDRITFHRKESGKNEFTTSEINKAYNCIYDKLNTILPELKITDIFDLSA